MPTNETMGDIQLSVNLKAGDVKKSAETLSNAIKKVFEDSAGKEVDTKFKNLQSSMDKSTTKASQLTAKLEKLENTKIPTAEYKTLTADIERVGKAYERLLTQQERLEDMHKGIPEKLKEQIARLGAEYGTLENQLKELETTGRAFTLGSDTAEYQNLSNQLSSVNNQMRIQLENANRLSGASDGVTASVHNQASAFSGLGTSIKSALGSATRSLIDRLKTSVLGLNKSAQSSDFNFKKLFTTLLRYGFGIRSVFMLIRRLRSAIAEGIKNMAQFNGGVNNTNRAITSLKDSLTYLKNSWGAAFAPIITAVAPILNTLIGMLASAANAIAAFFAILTGKKTVMRAVKTQSALGSAVGGTSKKLKEEGEEAKKTVSRLAAFDDLDILDPPEEDKLDDIADDLGGGGGGGAANPIQFEEVDAESLLSDYALDWLERLKEAWANGEWSNVGLILAEGMNRALLVLDDWINDTFAPWAQTWAYRLAEILNGVVAGLDWELLGKTFADGVNSITTAIHTFFNQFNFSLLGIRMRDGIINAINTLDWAMIGRVLTDTFNAKWDIAVGLLSTNFNGEDIGSALGKGIAKGLNSAIKNINFGAFIEMLKLALENVIHAIESFLDNFDFDALYAKIQEVTNELWIQVAEFIANTNWSTLGMKIGYALGELIAQAIKWVWNNLPEFIADIMLIAEGLVELLSGAILGLFGGLLDTFMELGRDSINGFYQGLLEALDGIHEWLKTNVVDPIVDGVKSLLGINSPSTVFRDIGKWVMEGLFQGITEMVKKVLTAWEDLKKKAIDLFNKMKDEVTKAWEGMWSGIKSTINKIIGGVEGFANGVVKAINKVIDALNSLSIDIPAIGDFGGFSIGINIPKLSEISIPRLAQGAVIPPNREFLAMLGDQQSGTNIEAPLDVITQAMRDALSDMNFGQSQYSEMTLDGETFARLIVPYVVSELNRTGYAVNLLEG